MFPKRLQRIIKYLFYSGLFGGTFYLVVKQGIKQFIVNLPTIYHSLFFIFLGILLWGINIHVLEHTNIDCTSLLATNESRPLRNQNNNFINYHNIYKLAYGYFVILFTSVLIYNYCDTFYEKSTTQWIAIITLIASIYALLMPNKILYRKERKKFLDALVRIVTPTFKLETAFCDVVMADLITSFSKVVGDIYVALAEIFLEVVVVPYADKKYGDNTYAVDGRSQKEISVHLHHHILLDLFGAIMILVPYLFRLRQCVADYFTKATKSQRRKSLLNAIKYGTSIPLYILSGYYSWIKSDIKNTSDKELLDPMYRHAKIVFTFWVISSFINSGYSYYWDLYNDWELCKKKKHDDEKFPFLLRPILHFSKHWMYYIVMIIDLILRFTWFVDVFSIFQLKNLFLVDDTPTIPEDIKKMKIQKLLLSRLLLRILEIIRRWLWIFFRLEKEWVFTSSEYRLLA
ncbi:EXS-domain-containing protein [Piromyces finnis]|uniref:EXS-domain-containing protein n=1 Tax=Piromyces finnis TaxID=1754191 RepID=A0A1Y1VER6_9FUNG|nr:EXS-domain-containing protein [Piromyces finnis]|eukprot:ORX53702.1 EXS-domain-containing protein [Piromyces finnis]